MKIADIEVGDVLVSGASLFYVRKIDKLRVDFWTDQGYKGSADAAFFERKVGAVSDWILEDMENSL